MALTASPWREKPDYPELDPMDPINRGRIFSSSLGDGRGLTCRDISRYKNNGTLNNFGAYPWVPGYQGGQAIQTNGTTTFVNFGAPPQLEFVATDQFTIAIRVKSSANPGGQAFAVGKDFSTGSRGFGIGISTSGQLYIESGGQVAFSGTGPVFGNTGRSTLIGGNQSGDGSQNWTGFVDGLSIGTLNSSFAYAANSLANWYVGGRSYSGFFNGLSAVIENFDIWNRQLSAAEWLRLKFDPFAGLRFDSDEGYRALAGGGNVTGVGSSAGVGAASGVGAELAASVGTSTGAATAPGVGAELATSIGTSTGAATAAGVGAELAASVGSSSGAATAPGKSVPLGIGTAAGVGAANGISLSNNVAGVGTATGTCAVRGIPPLVWTLIPPLAATWTPNAVPSPTWAAVALAGATWTKQFP